MSVFVECKITDVQRELQPLVHGIWSPSDFELLELPVDSLSIYCLECACALKRNSIAVISN